ncbi:MULTISPECIES: hypothetical protein [Streptomyces]|uniref:hypothetical protein n=1 Tax=Streptomyces TaxID=1883 RepID=UPI0004CD1DB0|nr:MULTISPECIES: hypothetical protein [Streptomyces]
MSEAAASRRHTNWSWLSHPQVKPWAMLAEVPATFLSHDLIGQDPVNTAWLTLGSCVLSGLSWWITRGASRDRRIHMTATTGMAAGLFTLGTVSGPEPILVPMVLASAGTAVSWNLRKTARANEDRPSGESGDSKIMAAINLAKAKVRDVKAEANKVSLTLEPERGQATPDEVQQAVQKLPPVFGMRANAARVQQDQRDSGLYRVTLTPEDMLTDPTRWRGPRNAGLSVAHAPVEIGLWEDGPFVPMWFAGDKKACRNATHWRTSGMNGSGKSHMAKLAWTDLFTRPDVAQIGGDPVKGAQTVGPCQDVFEFWSDDVDHIEQILLGLEDVTKVRGDMLARLGLDQWTPEAFEKEGIPYIVFSLEEIPRLLRRGIDLTDAAQTLRSLGVSLVLSAQRWSYKNVDTDVRAQTGGAVTFGLESAADAKFSLSDEAMDAGAAPEAWKNDCVGYFYAEGPGIPKDRIATPARTFDYEDADLTQVIEAYKPHRTPIDETTAKALGPVFAEYQQQRGLTKSMTALPTHHLTKGRDMPDDEDRRAAARVAAQLPPIDPELLEHVEQPCEELAGDFDLDPTVGQQEMTKEQAMQALKDLLVELAAEGKTRIGPGEVAARYPKHIGGRGRSWTSKALKAIAEATDEGLLRPAAKAGEYYIVTAQLQPA